MVVVKLFASMLLLVCLLVGISKADKRLHSPAYPPLAEYATGFILSSLAVAGFYYLWIG